MPKIDPEIEELLFRNDMNIQKVGMAPMSLEELRKLYHEQANRRMGLAPTSANPDGTSRTQRLPIAGFQGNSMFPNRAGGFMDQSGLGQFSAGLGGPAQAPQPLDPMGQPQQNYQIPRRPDMTQMAQMNPQMGQQVPQGGPRGFTTNIQIGEDGQVSHISLKKAMQKRMRL